MRRFFSLIVSMSLIGLISCEYDTQYYNQVSFVIDNEVSCALFIDEVDYNEQWNTVNGSPTLITTNDSETILSWVEVNASQITKLDDVKYYLPKKLKVVFNDEYAIYLVKSGVQEDMPHITLDEEKCNVVKKRDGYIQIVYAITEGDYRYAQEHGAKL